MFSKKLKIYIGLGTVLSLLHGLELAQTDFITNTSYLYSTFFQNINEAVYYMQHVGIYVALFIIFCFVMGRKWMYIPLLFFGYILTVETHHILQSIFTLSYIDGMFTSTLFLPLAVLYWKEFLMFVQTQRNN